MLSERLQFDPKRPKHVISVLRLAAKYLINPMRKLALENLQHRYPYLLSTWDANVDENPHGEFTPDLSEIMDVIAIARSTMTEVLLPSAFYYLCGYAHNQFPEQFFKHLPSHEYHVYAIGKEQLGIQCPLFLDGDKFVDRVPSDTCTGKNCQDSIKHLAVHGPRQLLSVDRILRPNPLAQLKELLDLPGPDHPLCPDCRRELEADICLERRRVWKELPTFFGLGNWEALREASSH
jgi:hypothetical protein